MQTPLSQLRFTLPGPDLIALIRNCNSEMIRCDHRSRIIRSARSSWLRLSAASHSGEGAIYQAVVGVFAS